MINPMGYLLAVEQYRAHPEAMKGGQELLLGEIIGALVGYRSVCLPLAHLSGGGLLRDMLLDLGHEVICDANGAAWEGADALYFGTPTIVNGRPLFPDGERDLWTKAGERAWVRGALRSAERSGIRRILCGLGSGDISLDERLAELGGAATPTQAGAEVITMKRFTHFTDWLILKDLRL